MAQHDVKQSSALGSIVDQHLRLLLWLGILVRVLVASLALLASFLPAFDSSPEIILKNEGWSFFKRWIATSLRWDALHFLSIAQHSYKYEHEWAFFPGVPLLLRLSGSTLDFLTRNIEGPSIYNMLLGHYILSIALTPGTARTLYRLTLQHTHSPSLSLLASSLSLLSSSPAALCLAPYTEPWFTFFSYKGMLYSAQKQWLLASGMFTLASMFRSNGILLGGFIVWGMVVEPLLTRRRIIPLFTFLCIPLCLFPILPFAGLQFLGYRTYCTHPSSPAPSWCGRSLPLIYTHVQSHYWNVGFLRYWTLQQLPNFIIAAPVLILLFYSSTTYLFHVASSLQRHSSKSKFTSPLLGQTLLPHAIHALIMTCVLLFASHTQIILRLASSMPFTYWAAARLFVEHPRWGRAWVAWSVVWGAVSVVLWTTFLPPA